MFAMYNYRLINDIWPSYGPWILKFGDLFWCQGYIDLMFGISVYNDELHNKFTFCSGRMIFGRVMALGLWNVANICQPPYHLLLEHSCRSDTSSFRISYEKWRHPFFMKCRHLSILFLYIHFSLIRFSLHSEGKPPVISTYANYRWYTLG